jgi:hypothetical protein
MATANGPIEVVLSMAKTGRFKRVVSSFRAAVSCSARGAVRPSTIASRVGGGISVQDPCARATPRKISPHGGFPRG